MESLKLYRDMGDKDEIPSLLHNLGCVALYREDYAKAISFFREGLLIHQEVGKQAGIAECLTGIAGALIGQGEAERGARLLGAAEVLRESVGAML